MITLSSDDRARLDRAVKDDDSPYTTFVISPWSKYLAWGASRRGLSPNQVTLASLAVALLAACCCATGARWAYVVGAVLLQVSFGLDCADGQLARLTGAFSELGAWLDAMVDRLKEYAVYAGLAAGSARAGDDVWVLAVVALVLQTLRHALDSSWAVTPASTAALNEGAVRRAAGERRRWHWSRKVAILPIGERWALVSVLTALTEPRIVFAALIGAGGLAGVYMLAARVRRSLRPSDPGAAADAALQLNRMRGAGPTAALIAAIGPRHPAAAVALPLLGGVVHVAAVLAALRARSGLLIVVGALAFAVLAGLGGRRPPDPRWGWVVPPLLRGVEYATVAAAASVSGAGVGAVCYGYLLVLVWHHYDSAYRLRRGMPRAGTPLMTRFAGVELRTVAVAALAGAGAAVFTATLVAVTGVLAVLAVRDGRSMWRQSEPPGVGPGRRGGHR
jgi:phosphatidylglycerophosphate synthase